MVNSEDSKIKYILEVLVKWSGVTDDSPWDTEIITYNDEMITLENINDALDELKSLSKKA